MHNHSRRALHDRLNHEGGNLAFVRNQQKLNSAQKLSNGVSVRRSRWQTAHIGQRCTHHIKQQWLEQRMKARDPADARATQCIAMIRFAKRDEFNPSRLRLLTLSPVLKS